MKKLLTVALLAVAAIPLQAAEETTLSPFAGNVGNALWTLVIFVIVVLILGKFAWGPILSLLKQREDFIHKSLSDAKHDREEAEARLREYGTRLQSAQAEAVSIIEEARRDSERLRQELRDRARSEADTMIKNAERQIDLQTTRAVQQLRQEAVELSVTIAAKILERNISKEDNEKLIADALRQIESASRSN
jgi:F-type H+-transporting ATPase subunit b